MNKYKLEIRESNGHMYHVFIRIDSPKIMIYIDSNNEILQDEPKLLAYLNRHFHSEKVSEYNRVNSRGCGC